MGSLASTQTWNPSLGEVGRKKLRALGAALDLSSALTEQALEVFDLMSGAWSDWPVGDTPVWPNDISDDGTPFEFSASFDGRAPRLRMLAESQLEPISKLSSWAAGLAFGERLAKARLADLSMFEAIRDLFTPPPGLQARFTLWHAAVIEEARPALFKAYVNPCLFGVGTAPYVVEQALRRLHFEDAWHFLEERLASNPGSEIRYFSVDLEDPAQARVKVYLGCSESAQAVDRLIAPAYNSRPNDASGWLDTLTRSQGPFEARPILSCFSFRRGASMPEVTVHVPIRCYVKHDAEALERVSGLLTATDASRLSRALSAVSERPLNVGRGLLTYASLRREAAAVRVTVYLAPEAYSITSRRPSAPPPSNASSGVHKTSPRAVPINTAHMGNVQALITRHEHLLRMQPLFAKLQQPGTVEQAQRIASSLALLALWLGDSFRFASGRTTNSDIEGRLAELSNAHGERAHAFVEALEKRGISSASLPLLSEEHLSIRELAFARVADVIAATDDCVRLGIALSVFATCRVLLDAALEFSERMLPMEGALTSITQVVPGADADLSHVSMTDAVATLTHVAVDRSFESLLRVVTAIERATFGA